MKIDLTPKQWEAVRYALDLWTDCQDGTITPFERVGRRALEKVRAATVKVSPEVAK